MTILFYAKNELSSCDEPLIVRFLKVMPGQITLTGMSHRGG
jgi:hypothetical protein